MIATVKKGPHSFFCSGKLSSSGPPTSAEYWTEVNVTNHHRFETRDDSLDYLNWRNTLYFNYIDLMPLVGRDREVVLDYGCGPGHDTVGFGIYSKPSRLIAMDVSPTSLAETATRMQLHGIQAETLLIEESAKRLPLADDSIDYIHSSGVIHHTPDPVSILREFRRVLRPGGQIRIMVYNYHSLFLHLRTAYLVQIKGGQHTEKTVRGAFQHLTDGPNCPISNVYKPEEFLGLANEAGLQGELLGCAVASGEMEELPLRFEAIGCRQLAQEHREFLAALTFDERGLPLYRGIHAGVDACYRFSKS